MKKFYTDVDGVLLDLEPVICKSLEDLTGRAVSAPWCFLFEEAYGLPASMMKPLFDSVWMMPAELSLYAVMFVHELHKKGFEVIGLSHRPGTAAKQAALRDLANLPLDNLILVENQKDKIPFFKPGTYYVDDLPILAATAGDLGATSYLLTQGTNKQCHDFGNYTRVSSLLELTADL